jgi:NADH:ubiquinone oxidoreductase subunit 4 (subunit M)
VLVKFAFFGFFKLLLAVGCDAPSLLAYPLLSFGLVDAAFKIFYQTDLKKIVAYATVIEMH